MRRMNRVLLAVALLISSLFVGSPQSAHAAGYRWIDVDLSNQTATAYQGDTAVYTALVSTGATGTETPTGSFSILNRVASETMDSSTIGISNDAPGGYYVTGVAYTQYFTGAGNALHANYWASPNVFGNVPTSHGCVGMTTGDAAYFWDFADYGTPVEIHY
jgi:lipoprotein-anchoring transpeptidase ErfK/SrfK